MLLCVGGQQLSPSALLKPRRITRQASHSRKTGDSIAYCLNSNILKHSSERLVNKYNVTHPIALHWIPDRQTRRFFFGVGGWRRCAAPFRSAGEYRPDTETSIVICFFENSVCVCLCGSASHPPLFCQNNPTEI